MPLKMKSYFHFSTDIYIIVGEERLFSAPLAPPLIPLNLDPIDEKLYSVITNIGFTVLIVIDFNYIKVIFLA